MAKSKSEKALEDLAELAEREYGVPLSELLRDPDDKLRERRLWRLTGVILKRNYSSEAGRRPTRATGAVYRWDIDPDLLAKRVKQKSWEVELLGSFTSRRKDEPIVKYALRLKSETNFGKALRKNICGWICSDPDALRDLERAFREAGFGKYGKWAKPAKVIGALSLVLAARMPGLSHEGFMLAFAGTFGLATIGLKTMCEVGGYGPPKKAKLPIRKKAAKKK